jgi:hypothetical protein
MELTEKMKTWLNQHAQEHYQYAKNCHIWALSSDTNDEATELELCADEHRAFARTLENLAKEN